MNRFYFIAAVLVIGVLAVGMLISAANLAYFADLPSFALVLVIPLTLCFATFSPKDMGGSFRAAFNHRPIEVRELRLAAVFFKALERYFLLAGLITALIGIVSILAFAQDPKQIGKGFSVLLLGVLYSLGLMLVLAVPFRVSVDRRLIEVSGAHGETEGTRFEETGAQRPHTGRR